ncbi:MAG: phage tail tape measure protein [Lachnospiraceae bacterium]|nr:phage tail tape measure protein [Lachnospiraceae bacterium]
MDLFTLIGRIALDTSEMDRQISDSMESAATKFKNLGSQMTRTGLTMTATVTAPILAIGKKAVSVAADFESAMSRVSAISGATGSELDALQAKAEEMGRTTKFSATEAATAMEYMAMAGWKTGEMLDGISGIMDLAAASGEDLATVSDIVTDALTAFGLKASDAGHFADVLAAASSNANTNVSMMGETFKYVAPVAGALGYSVEDVAEMIGLMANAGIKSTQAGTSLRTILSSLQGELTLTGQRFGEATVATTNADGSMRDLGDIINDLRSYFSQMTESEAAATAEMLVGREAMSGFLAIMQAAPADIDKLSSAIAGCDGVSASMAATMQDNLQGQLTLLKSQLEGLAIQFVTLIMPYLRDAVDWLSKLLTWISNLDEGTKRMIITVGGIVAAVGPVILILGRVVSTVGTVLTIGSKLVGGIGTVIGVVGKLSGGIGKLVSGISGTLIPAIMAIPTPVKAVIAIAGGLVAAGIAVYKNWDEISAWGKKAWGAIQDTVSAAAGKIADTFHGLVESAKDKFSDMYTSVTGKIHDLKESAVNKIHDLKESAVNKFHELKEKASNKISELKESAVSKFEELKSAAVNKIHDLKESAVNKFHELKEKAGNKISELKESAVSKFNELKSAASERVEAIKTFAVEKFESLRSSAVEAVTKLKDSAVSKITELKDKAVSGFKDLAASGIARFEDLRTGISNKLELVKNFVSGAVDKLKSFFHFDWSLPKIKLPHFSIKGSFSLSPPSIPHFAVEWYKNGGIMMQPTAFGINPRTGAVMAGGEAGAEAIAPIQLLQEYVKHAVDSRDAGFIQILNMIYKLLNQYLPMLAQKQIVLDSGEMVGALASGINVRLGDISKQDERIR